MNTKTAYELLTEEAHRAGERGYLAEKTALQLAKALVNQHGLTGAKESADMLRIEAEKRARGGLTANATALNYGASFLMKFH